MTAQIDRPAPLARDLAIALRPWHPTPPAVEFRVLFVCTGNICRSPVAEIMMRHLLIGRLGGNLAARFSVSSAGVAAVVDAQIHPYTRDELMPWSLDGHVAGLFRARQLDATMVRRADLVLGATPSHRSAAVVGSPEGLRTAFSIREFALLVRDTDRLELSTDPVERARELVHEALRRRGTVPMDRIALGIPDPMGKSQRDHHVAVRATVHAVHDIVNAIVPRR